jgi:hypothetical protein
MEPLPFCDMPKEGVKLVWCNLAWTLPIEFWLSCLLSSSFFFCLYKGVGCWKSCEEVWKDSDIAGQADLAKKVDVANCTSAVSYFNCNR